MLHNFETLKVDRLEGDVLQVTLNRPERRNAVSRQMHEELIQLIFDLRGERDLGAVVLTGAGSCFSAGGDFDLLEENRSGDWRRTIRTLDQGVALVNDFLGIRPPVIAAINGPAVGLGASLALMSDLAIMADTAIIADTHVRVGIVAGDGGTLIWPNLLGHSRAKEFLLTGDSVVAKSALEMGLVNRVVAADQVLPVALEFAHRLAGGPRQAIAFTKQAINSTMLRESSQQMQLAIGLEARTMLLPDYGEGIDAFREKRAADWPSCRAEPDPA